MKKLLAVLLLASIPASYASEFPIITSMQTALEATALQGIDWKVGDSSEYSVKLKGMKLGTMSQSVTADEGASFWLKQEMNLMIQKQVVELLMERATGKILKYKLNGKEQAPPNETVEVIDQEYTEVTVPAGTFKAVHITAKTTQVPKLDIWLNPTDTVMDGMLKTIVPQQGMEMVIELTKFTRAQ
jgi:hypothetical protein